VKIATGESRSKGNRPKRKRLRSLRFAPTLLTLGNLWCGFAAIYFALRSLQPGAEAAWLEGHERVLPTFLSVGAGLIILGMVFDSLDGLVARVTHSTTDFGGQLDSLADVVTCGVAPPILMIAYIMQVRDIAGIELVPSPLSEYSRDRAVWVATAMYVAFAAIRLARYNVEHAEGEYDFHTFRGLPSPGAAAILAAMILFAQDTGTGALAKSVVAYALPIAAIATGLLMVSRIPYWRMNALNLRGRKPFGQVVIVVVVLAIFSVWKTPTLLVIVSAYGLSGPVERMCRRLRKGPPTAWGPSAGQRRHGHPAGSHPPGGPSSASRTPRASQPPSSNSA
jgi:CDP-diacylglycerol--serine O-phosphatidyltransferase